MITLLGIDTPFPPVDQALKNPDGLLALGGELSVHRLLDAYRQGVFPWFNSGDPILWWSPSSRMVIVPGEIKVSRSLHKVLRNKNYEIRTDSAFEQVMRACAAPRCGQHAGTWIHDNMIAAYVQLHRVGMAHSVETWINGRLAGGLYGVSIGRMFYGESMFSHVTDASKIALVHLARQLQRWNYGMIDCQLSTAHLSSLGAREIPRVKFMNDLKELVRYPDSPPRWRFDYEFAA
jgi:leucyl/phenylalanyl-tRNA---protein transferase